MDTITSGTETIQYQPITALGTSSPSERHCNAITTPGEFLLSSNPYVLLHVLTNCGLDPQDMANLEATCSFFRKPAELSLDHELSLTELAALDMCHKRAIFKPMTGDERQKLKQKCGGLWKLVLRFLLVGEACYRREKSQVIAGPGHSIVVTSKGVVYSFGLNESGQLGHGTTKDEWKPRQIRSLQGIRIIQAVAGIGRTMLISDAGKVYAFGRDSFKNPGYEAEGDNKSVCSPQQVESLKHIFVVQAAIGNFFSAVLSREGRIYTFCWGNKSKLGHDTENDREPYPLLGILENIPVVQIAAGHCYLLALAFQPSGISVYSVGCGLGGKLGHGSNTKEALPRLIEHFQTLNLQPVMVSAGSWHAAVVGKDGRVCTWGWGCFGCLGHGNDDSQSVPKVVEALSAIKAVHVNAAEYSTFVVSDDGNVYSFGFGTSSLGHNTVTEEGNVLIPKIVSSLEQINEKVVQVSSTDDKRFSSNSETHTLVLTESGKLFAFGDGVDGQLGVNLVAADERLSPEQVDVDLS